MTTMRAAVCVRAGGPEVLEIREIPMPAVRAGWSLVAVRGAGLNRSELRTRQGHSPNVRFPRVLGIECVGVVADSTDPALPEGTTVAAVMGEMGRDFDGGYAEYALLPNALLMPITTTLPWEVLAALPETYLTAQGALDVLELTRGDRLLIRGGTSSVGLAAASIASALGVEVAATTRRPESRRRPESPRPASPRPASPRPESVRPESRTPGRTDGFVHDDEITALWSEGPSQVLDLVGTATVVDSLRVVRRGGTVCVAGSLSGWLIESFEPIAMIPSGTRLTAFHSGDATGSTATLQRIVGNVESGVYRPGLDRVVGLDDIADAHRYMENNQATGKVVMTPRGPGR